MYYVEGYMVLEGVEYANCVSVTLTRLMKSKCIVNGINRIRII